MRLPLSTLWHGRVPIKTNARPIVLHHLLHSCITTYAFSTWLSSTTACPAIKDTPSKDAPIKCSPVAQNACACMQASNLSLANSSFAHSLSFVPSVAVRIRRTMRPRARLASVLQELPTPLELPAGPARQGLCLIQEFKVRASRAS